MVEEESDQTKRRHDGEENEGSTEKVTRRKGKESESESQSHG